MRPLPHKRPGGNLLGLSNLKPTTPRGLGGLEREKAKERVEEVGRRGEGRNVGGEGPQGEKSGNECLFVGKNSDPQQFGNRYCNYVFCILGSDTLFTLSSAMVFGSNYIKFTLFREAF